MQPLYISCHPPPQPNLAKIHMAARQGWLQRQHLQVLQSAEALQTVTCKDTAQPALVLAVALPSHRALAAPWHNQGTWSIAQGLYHRGTAINTISHHQYQNNLCHWEFDVYRHCEVV